MDWPDSRSAAPLFLHTWTRYSALTELRHTAGLATPASFTWTASLAKFVPMSIPFPYPVHRVYWTNGTSTPSTTVAMGIYSMDGRRIYSTGNTLQGTLSTIQYVSVTPFVLSPGNYMFGWWCTGGNMANRAYGSNSVSQWGTRAVGVVEVAGMAVTDSFPSSVTFAQHSVAALPVFGVTRSSTGWI